MTRTVLACALAAVVLAVACARNKPMDKCLQKDLAQCEEACTGQAMGVGDMGLACSAAASKYEKGTPPDWNHAVALLDRACTAGAHEVCVDVANRYYKGYPSLPRDRVKSRAYYKKACDANYAPGCAGIEHLNAVDELKRLTEAYLDGGMLPDGGVLSDAGEGAADASLP